ncbi:MAG: hypothetical protein JRJ42_10765 [Deltaproteobacteria bacterium]|nr:hypothetical protein [Deltaproteobacteria bacterium]
MEKKTLLNKPAGEKKSSTKKKTPTKKSVRPSGAKKKDLKQQEKAKKRTAPTKKATTKSKPTAKSKSTAKAKGKKVAAVRKRKISIKDLLFKKFDTGPSKKPVAERPQKVQLKLPEAPPFVMLFKQFDLKSEPPVEETKAAAPVEEAVEPISTDVKGQEYEPPASVLSAGSGPDSMAKAIKAGLLGVVALIAIIIGASFSNQSKFYLKHVDGAVQVWRGKFAPTGTELVLSLDDMEISQPVRDVYSKKEVYPIVFGYFQDKADASLNEPEGPDFAKIKRYLHQAASYAPTEALRNMVEVRLNGIDFLVLLHKADVALIKGTLPDLETAKACLDKAGLYASSDYQRELLVKRKAVVDRAIAALAAK